MNEKPIIYIDGLNVFMRHFAANPSKSLNGQLCGECRKKDRTRISCLRVGILKPIVQKWERRFYAKGPKYNGRSIGHPFFIEIVEQQGSGVLIVHHGAGQ